MTTELKDSKDWNKRLEEFQNSIGYRFKNIETLTLALTHSSYHSNKKNVVKVDNERLEFLGDAFVDFAIGKNLFDKLNGSNEGDLSLRRAKVVSSEALAKVALEVGIDKVFLVGKKDLELWGKFPERILASALEAVIGGIVVDASVQDALKVVSQLFAVRVDSILTGEAKDPKSILQEYLQEQLKLAPIYETEAVLKDGIPVSFKAKVFLRERLVGEGSGLSKKIAQTKAAESALNMCKAIVLEEKYSKKEIIIPKKEVKNKKQIFGDKNKVVAYPVKAEKK